MRKSILTTVAVALILSGCASSRALQQRYDIVWPSSPQAPRVAFIQNYQGKNDFYELTFWDQVFGKEIRKDLQKPYGVFARGSKIYVSDTVINAVVVIDTKERTVTFIGDSGKGRLRLPLGMDGTPDGTLYVTDGTLRAVNIYDREGKFVRSLGGSGDFKSPSGIAVNSALDRIYIADSRGHKVRVYAMNGDFLFEFGARGDGDGQFNNPTNVAIDRRNNNVLVTDTNGFRVEVFDQDGKFLRKFGEVGDGPGSFVRPKGIGVDSEGNVYVVDAGFNNVQIFSETGALRLFVAGPGRGSGEFNLPAGLYIDDQDRFYVVDSINTRVAVFQFMSEKWKKDNPDEYGKYVISGNPETKLPDGK